MDIVNPYEPGKANLDLATQPAELELADRLTRLLAVLVDAGLFLIFPAIIAVLTIPQSMNRWNLSGASEIILVLLILAPIILLLMTLRLMRLQGQTYGKRFLKIKVVRTDGSQLSLDRWILYRILVIGLVGAIPYVGWVASIADSLAIFRDSRQCLHDQIADTLVVKT